MNRNIEDLVTKSFTQGSLQLSVKYFFLSDSSPFKPFVVQFKEVMP